MRAPLFGPTLLMTALLGLGAPAFAIEQGTDAPDFTLADFEGQTVSLSQFKGQVVVLNFWATWCAPCRAELPLLDALAADQQEVVYLAVNIDERDKKAKIVWEKLALQMPMVWDPEQVTVAAFSPNAMPTTYVIGADGTVAWIEQGAVEPQTVAEFGKRVSEVVAGGGSTPTAVVLPEAPDAAPAPEQGGQAAAPEAPAAPAAPQAPEPADPSKAPLADEARQTTVDPVSTEATVPE